MPTTRIRRDEHGLYVRTDGQVFRPEPSRGSYPHGNNPLPSTFVENAAVHVEHLSGTPLCRVATHVRDYSETWNSHGQYLQAGGLRKSRDCWTPPSET
jgi:hypothetical protein